MKYKKGDLVLFGFDEWFQIGIVKGYLDFPDGKSLVTLDTVNDSPNGPVVNYAMCEPDELVLIERYGYTSTGKKDANGVEVFVGDKIIHAWGWSSDSAKGKLKPRFRLHTINVKPAHRLAYGGMHDDGGGIVFCMGDCYNYWKGNEVQILTDSEYKTLKSLGVKEDDTDFIYDKKNKPEVVDIWKDFRN